MATEVAIPSWVELAAPDAAAAVDFYGALFGWTCQDGIFRCGGDAVAGVGDARHAGWLTVVAVADPMAAARAAEDAGGDVLVSSARGAVIADPSGALFAVREGPFAERWNSPVSLTWNELQTRDIPAAVGFYAAVLGWDADGTESFEGPYTVWRFDGRPVAGMTAIELTRPQVPPHWSVTFAVADTEATVAAARALGAALLHGPVDTPAGRLAVFGDPQGATFSVLQS